MILFGFKIIIGLSFFYFIPGYLFLKIFLKREGLTSLESFTSALIVSPVILILPLCLMTSILNLSLKTVSLFILLEISILLVLVISNFNNSRKFTLPTIKNNKIDWAYIVGFIIIISLIIAVQLASTRIQWSHHGTYHGGIVYQILNDIIPPNNSMLYGQPISHYWMFHLKLAILSHFLQISPVQASVLNNLYALITTLLILYCLARYIVSQRFLRGLFPFFILSITNILGPFYSLSRILSKNDAGVNLVPLNFIIKIFGSPTHLDRRLVGIFYKFFNFQGFPEGILYTSALIFFAVLMLNKKKNYYPSLLFISLLGTIMFHTPSLTVPILSTAILFLCLYFTGKNKRNIAKINIFKLFLGFVFTLILTLPYIYSLAKAFPTQAITLTDSLDNIKNLLIYYWPFFPVYIYGVIVVLKKRNPVYTFILLNSIVIFLAASLLSHPDRNQYKIMYQFAIPFGAIILYGINTYMEKCNKKTFSFSLLFPLWILSLALPMAWSYKHLTGYWAKNKDYISKGINVELRSKVSDLSKTYRWIRSSTDKRSVLVAPSRHYNRTNLEFLSQRRIYVCEGSFHTKGDQLFYERMGKVSRLFTPNADKIDVLKELQSIEDDVYLILFKKDNPTNFSSLEKEFSQYDKHLELAFHLPYIEIYKILKITLK